MSSRKKAPNKKGPNKQGPNKKAAVKKAVKKKAVVKKAPAKKAAKVARPATPKVSPLKGLPVLQWVRSKANAWQIGVIANLSELVSSSVHRATCSIKWGQPVFELNGPMAFIKLAADHVTFGFWRGAELTDPAGLLEGAERMKHIKIGDDEAFDRARIIGFVREAAALNLKLGDPTKRGRG